MNIMNLGKFLVEKRKNQLINKMLEGKSAEEIATELDIDIRIVCSDRHKLLKALGLKSEVHLLGIVVTYLKEENEKLATEIKTLRGEKAA